MFVRYVWILVLKKLVVFHIFDKPYQQIKDFPSRNILFPEGKSLIGQSPIFYWALGIDPYRSL